MSDKPIILISTGAWHPPECYAQLRADLETHGYEVVIPQHPSMGADKQGVTWKADKESLVGTAETYFEAEKVVVLVAHSYGGVPGGAATEGHGIGERRENELKGGFREIIFVASFAIPVKGWDLLTSFGGTWPEWQTRGEKYTRNHLTRPNKMARELFYNDASAEEAQRAFDMLLPHSQDAFEAGCDFVASDITIPKTLVICEKDKVFPIALQEMLVQSTPGMKEIRIVAGHCPFVGKAEEMTTKLLDIIEKRRG